MPEIKRIELERDNDQGVHEVKEGERLEPVEPAPPESAQPGSRHARHPGDDSREDDKQVELETERNEFERATTPFPGG